MTNLMITKALATAGFVTLLNACSSEVNFAGGTKTAMPSRVSDAKIGVYDDSQVSMTQGRADQNSGSTGAIAGNQSSSKMASGGSGSSGTSGSTGGSVSSGTTGRSGTSGSTGGSVGSGTTGSTAPTCNVEPLKPSYVSGEPVMVKVTVFPNSLVVTGVRINFMDKTPALDGVYSVYADSLIGGLEINANLAVGGVQIGCNRTVQINPPTSSGGNCAPAPVGGGVACGLDP